LTLTRFIVLLALGFILTPVASAQEAVNNPGRLLASNCFQCHGTNGAPKADGFDRLAGMSVSDLVEELTELRSGGEGEAESAIMVIHAQAYSTSEIDLLARYFASLTEAGLPKSTTGLPLDVTLAGTGAGRVTSSPAGISCTSGTCSSSYVSGTSVKLTAAATAGSTFLGWSGNCTGTSSTCTVKVSVARTVTASFGLGTYYTVKLSKSGASYGAVTATEPALTCGSGCSSKSALVLRSTSVTFTAQANAGRRFAGWSGACKGTVATCTVSVTAAKTVTATFK